MHSPDEHFARYMNYEVYIQVNAILKQKNKNLLIFICVERIEISHIATHYVQ